MRRGWAAAALLREAVRRLNRGYEALPRATRRAWWRALAAGALGVELLALGLVWIARRAEGAGALRWEAGALRWLDTRASLSFSTGMWLEGMGNGFVLWGVMLSAAAVAAWRGRPLRSLSFLVGYSCVYLFIATAWWAWDRPRPTLIAYGIGTPGGFFHSFPSGHMVQTAFAYGLLVHLWLGVARTRAERAAAMAAYALLCALVAVGRLRIGVHWPSDVVAGTVIGLAWAVAVVAALRAAERSLPGNARHPSRI